ncbi:CRISPR-associated helicase/endonuclease Cas3 [Acrocarpospora pleiomorpha]|uniref:CRISPR-associated helicase/endonuclease Cas3 n=1 Tax=Acrocarpospora pleiomorpha TaxID=90975 RepID=A0A5M3XTP0_9ACTN|nr:CRISPR-associated helicase Cas3' [Acrocarpospora pleiomorpha]GES21738.1 CRISPR-associated helicase/endonuclease Cas3 [Acrocarpospora pleiomorpha]
MRKLSHTWAKSPRKNQQTGELLTAHSMAALEAAQLLSSRVGRIAVLPGDFWRWACLACLLHDAGKVAEGFQLQVGNGPAQARRWGERHEVLSLGFVSHVLADLPQADREWVALGVVTHHRPLTGLGDRCIFARHADPDPASFISRFGPVELPLVTELAAWLTAKAQGAALLSSVPSGMQPADVYRLAHQMLDALKDRWDRIMSRRSGLAAVLLQGAVTLADHVSSAHGSLQTRQPIDAAFAHALSAGVKLHKHQELAAAVQGHLLLRAPTGSGKTEAVELWAATQVEAIRKTCGGEPRVFDTLPYLASINAMATRIGNQLGDTALVGVAHSKAASYHLNQSVCDDSNVDTIQAAKKAVARGEATRLFQEMVRVGTPYQLMRGALAGPAHAGLLIDAANSVFILDELHAYDTQRMGIILAMLGLWEELGGRIAVISATLPRALSALLCDALAQEPTEVNALDDGWAVRHRLSVCPEPLTSASSIEKIAARLQANEAVLLVANNIADARLLYNALGPLAGQLHGPGAALLLHSRFKAGDRAKIEKQIMERYGVGVPHMPGLLVSTQVVEVSLNVDFSSIHTSGAPLEALLQRFGRVNRLAKREPADVIVHHPDYRKRRSGTALWADGVYDEAPTKLTMGILERNHGAMLDEKVTGEWLDEIYDSPWGIQWAEDVTSHREQFSEAFLQFKLPFDDRTKLADEFDEMFDGIEAVLADDIDNYTTALNSTDEKSAGRLLASEYLLPLPHYAVRLGRFDRDLRVVVIDAEYDAESGLGTIRTDKDGPVYLLGELL